MTIRLAGELPSLSLFVQGLVGYDAKKGVAVSPAFSCYLDLVQFLAAPAVFLDHLHLQPFTIDIFDWRIGVYGPCAVTVFFVLSGYVISHVVASQERTAARYAASRAARLKSALLITLGMTLACDFIGMQTSPWPGTSWWRVLFATIVVLSVVISVTPKTDALEIYLATTKI